MEASMSDHDPLPRPPRRHINGETWVWTGAYQADVNGIVGRWKYRFGDELERAGFAMGCVKDDDGQLGPVD
jgi:hypothetical protein